MEDGSLEASTIKVYLQPHFMHLYTWSDTLRGDNDLSRLLQWSWSDGLNLFIHPSISPFTQHLWRAYYVPGRVHLSQIGIP